MVDESEDSLIVERLQTLGVTHTTEWEVLAFLYRHAASLATAAQIARLVGCDPAYIGVALHSLEGLGLIRRSRESQGVRLYQFSVPPEAARRACLLELISLAQNRTGRLLLLKHLKSSELERRRRGDSGLHLA